MMVLVVIIHNILEGMAVGVSFAGVIYGKGDLTMAGAMMYVVVEELVPEATGEGESHTNIGIIGFSIGFVGMMILDVML